MADGAHAATAGSDQVHAGARPQPVQEFVRLFPGQRVHEVAVWRACDTAGLKFLAVDFKLMIDRICSAIAVAAFGACHRPIPVFISKHCAVSRNSPAISAASLSPVTSACSSRIAAPADANACAL